MLGGKGQQFVLIFLFHLATLLSAEPPRQCQSGKTIEEEENKGKAAAEAARPGCSRRAKQTRQQLFFLSIRSSS
jgi:hypothetical protein